MKISLNWIKKYVDIPKDITCEFLAREISRTVAEVESMEAEGSNLENVFVGKIINIEKHPNADALKLCEVDLGKKEYHRVVCGGSNLKKGMLVAFAKPGAQVRWHGEGDLIKLEKAVIRGQESSGMICASTEIGLASRFPNVDKEILDLSALKLSIGDLLSEALRLDDVIFDIDNKTLSKRPDLFCHYGFAREIAAILDLPLKQEGIKDCDAAKKDFEVNVQDYNDCPRYMGVKIENITVAESPDWLKKNLESVGLRSINNIVDITNYVLLDLGQPMHAFDCKKIQDETITVRRAKNNEKLTLLDENELSLSNDDLVIADSAKPLALAGIMGGINCEIDNKTTKIFIEVANFNPHLIRRISTKHGVRTESSTRFEKALDPYLPQKGLARAVNLITSLIPDAKIVSKIVDMKGQLPLSVAIDLPKSKISAVLGVEISDEEIMKILRQLGFEVVFENEIFKIKVPSWRSTRDVLIAEDVIEEILRRYGYDNAPSVPAFSPLIPPLKNKRRDIERKVKDICSLGLGMNEVYKYSFVSPDILEDMGIDYQDYHELHNPIAKNAPFLRQSLVPNLMLTARDNMRFYDNFRIFEIGKVFLNADGEDNVDVSSNDLLPHQPYFLTGVFVDEKDKTPYYQAKAAAEYIFKKLNMVYTIIPEQNPPQAWMHFLRTARVEVLNDVVGYICELHPSVQAKLDIKPKVALFDFNFDLLATLAIEKKDYAPIAKFPKIDYDVSAVVDRKVLWYDIKNIILKSDARLVKGARMFDLFENEDLKKQNKKSIAFTITYQSDERTLEQDEAKKLHEKILKKLQKEIKLEIRQ